MQLSVFSLNFLSVGLLVCFPKFPYHMLSFLVMIIPTVGYIDTIRLMVTSKSAAAYDLQTVMIINGGQGAKVLYFIYHRYALSIFGQSVSLLIVATVMTILKYKYEYDEKQANCPPVQQNLLRRCRLPGRADFPRLLFVAQAQTFVEYCVSIGIYCAASYAVFLVCCVLFGKTITVDTTGLIGNLIESAVSLPTFAKIVIRRDINNVSTVLVLQYVFGDMMKIVLFTLAKTPWSFFFGAFCQLAIDTILFVSFLQLSLCPGKRHSDEERLNEDDATSEELSIPEADEEEIGEEEEIN